MVKTTKNIRSSYKLYKKRSKTPVSLKQYISLCNEYNKFLMGKVFEGHEPTLPSRLGTFSIVGAKSKIRFDEDGKPNLAPDWQKTIALWNKNPESKAAGKKVYHTNAHTNGVRYKLVWSKKRVIIKNKTLYSMRLTRANKRMISSEIKSGKEYFIKL